MTPAVRILGEFTDYAGLQELMRQRADGLNLSHETIEILANCTPGLSGKILAPRPSKRLGPENMGNFLPALGVKLIMVQDDDATAEIERRLKLGIIKNRNPNLANHSGVVIARFSRRQMRRNGKKGGTNSRKYMTREAASDLARAAVKRRKWRTPKVVEIPMDALGYSGTEPCQSPIASQGTSQSPGLPQQPTQCVAPLPQQAPISIHSGGRTTTEDQRSAPGRKRGARKRKRP